MIEFLGLKKEKMPTMRIVQMTELDVVKYKPESSDFTEENIQKFLDDFLADKVPVHYLSDELPEDWDSKPVKVRPYWRYVMISFWKLTDDVCGAPLNNEKL